MTTTHIANVAAARDLARRIRLQLTQLLDLLDHVESVRSPAFIYSLESAHDHAESAVVHALQYATRKVQP